MVASTSHQRVTAIVPAYNEAGRIGAVLSVLCAYEPRLEVIVVDDGSTDGTGDIARQFPVIYLRNDTNQGKGYTLDRGVGAATSDIIFFCDADVRGLSHKIVQDIIAPILEGSVDMFIGMRNRGIYFLHFILAFVPLLGGERALTRELWDRVPAYYKERFRIEAALNFYAKHYGRGFAFKVFRGLSQTIKERKYGLARGFASRCRMFYDIILAQIRLQTTQRPLRFKPLAAGVKGEQGDL